MRQSHTRLFLDCNAPREDYVGWWDVPTRVSSLLAAVAARRERLTGLLVSNSGHSEDCWGILGFFILGGMPALTTMELVGTPPKVGERCQPNGLGSALLCVRHGAPMGHTCPLTDMHAPMHAFPLHRRRCCLQHTSCAA